MSHEQAVEAIAQYLAQFGVNHDVHKTIVADIYDRVNELRDAKIEKAEELLSMIEETPNFLFSPELQSQYSRVTAFINEHLGE